MKAPASTERVSRLHVSSSVFWTPICSAFSAIADGSSESSPDEAARAGLLAISSLSILSPSGRTRPLRHIGAARRRNRAAGTGGRQSGDHPIAALKRVKPATPAFWGTGARLRLHPGQRLVLDAV